MRKPTVSKRDNNHVQTVTDLLTYHGGVWVEYYNIGIPGHPDGLHIAPGLSIVGKFDPVEACRRLQGLEGVARVFDGANVYVEVKNLAVGGKLRPEQVEWLERYPGPAVVMATSEDVIKYGQ